MLFSIVTYNRPQYAIESINQLIASVQKTDVIMVKDDCSKNDVMKHYLYHQLSKVIYPHVLIKINDRNIGVEKNNRSRIALHDFRKEHGDYIYFTDDDMQYSSEFYAQLMAAKQLIENNQSVGLISLFNIDNGNYTGRHMNIADYDNYKIKFSVGGCSMLIKQSDFLAAMLAYKSKKYSGEPGWDWAVCHYLKRSGKVILATANSYVQHIGAIGVNSNGDHYETAKNFIP